MIAKTLPSVPTSLQEGLASMADTDLSGASLISFSAMILVLLPRNVRAWTRDESKGNRAAKSGAKELGLGFPVGLPEGRAEEALRQGVPTGQNLFLDGR